MYGISGLADVDYLSYMGGKLRLQVKTAAAANCAADPGRSLADCNRSRCSSANKLLCFHIGKRSWRRFCLTSVEDLRKSSGHGDPRRGRARCPWRVSIERCRIEDAGERHCIARI